MGMTKFLPLASSDQITLYRPDIDGLRAVAVLGVVVFHATSMLLPGGFVGVDVFFVISGFLITGILIRDCETKTFSIKQFYSRRIRRILPALAAVLLTFTVVACVAIPPADLKFFGHALLSSSLFIANQFFLDNTGYFNVDAQESPLLHLWSLSIEEQFYLLWPPVVFLLYRAPLRRWAPLLIMMALVISLALAQRSVLAGDGAGAFYMLRARGWELLLGAFLATGSLPVLNRPRDREIVAGIGLAAVLGSMLLINSDTPFPGLAAAIPCLGAAALIHASRTGETFVGRWLSSPGMVLIGLISYPLYLWHWPLLAMPRLMLGRALSPVETGLSIILAFALAWLSWRFIEAPARSGKGDQSAHGAVIAGASVLIVTAGVALLIIAGQGFPERASPSVLQAEAARSSINPMNPLCHVSSGAEVSPADTCVTQRQGTAQIILWGDSHAAHLMPAITVAVGNRHAPVRQITKSSCLPLAPNRASAFATRECAAFNRNVLEELAGDARIETVVIAGRWTGYILGGFGEPGPRFRKELQETIANVRRSVGPQVEILVVGPLPDFKFEPSKCYARTRFAGLDTSDCRRSQPANGVLAAEVERVLADVVADGPDLRLVLPWGSFCGADTCATVTSGSFLFRDSHHLTLDGARFLAPLFAEAMFDRPAANNAVYPPLPGVPARER